MNETQTMAEQTEQKRPMVFSLSTITNRVREVLRPASQKTFWVRAEISSAREQGGSFYCDLIEAGPDGKVVAKMRCSIWSQDLRLIRQKFEEQGVDFQLSNGSVVVLCCQIQFSPQYGLGLKAMDADPSFALGEIEKRKQAILDVLRHENLLDPNKKLIAATVPRKIGLITSDGSAAYHDFTQTLERSGYTFDITLADAIVQGVNAERTILSSLACLRDKDLDLVVMIRGGGSKADLSWFDNEAIARAIAAYPLPVWCGIGHEIDYSVCDCVAHTSFKTPTAVAEELVARCVSTDRFLAESIERLRSVWQFRLDRETSTIEHSETCLKNTVRKKLDHSKAKLRELAVAPMVKISGRISQENTRITERGEKLRSYGKLLINKARMKLVNNANSLRPERLLARIEREDERLDAKLATVTSHDPEKQLLRGYAILRNAGGQIITGTKCVRKGTKLVAQMRDGNLKVGVEDVEKLAKP